MAFSRGRPRRREASDGERINVAYWGAAFEAQGKHVRPYKRVVGAISTTIAGCVVAGVRGPRLAIRRNRI